MWKARRTKRVENCETLTAFRFMRVFFVFPARLDDVHNDDDGDDAGESKTVYATSKSSVHKDGPSAMYNVWVRPLFQFRIKDNRM